MKKFYFLLIVSALILTANVNAAEPQKIYLWQNGAPNAVGIEEKDKPCITVYTPENNATDTAVVVCPGGGYGGLALNHEGKQIAEWYNSLGVTAVILEYRHRGKGYGHPNPMLDVQRAIRTVRFNAAAWKINPAKIGVMGFSAGGHLASTAATHFEDVKNPADETDKVSCRPDFAILCYPVIMFNSPFTHLGSQKNLIGDNPPQELLDYYSNEKQVSDKTPPVFIFFTTEDKVVPVQNGIAFYSALLEHKIPAEMHIFQKGHHGLGLAKGMNGNEIWSQLCTAWMQNNGFLPLPK